MTPAGSPTLKPTQEPELLPTLQESAPLPTSLHPVPSSPILSQIPTSTPSTPAPTILQSSVSPTVPLGLVGVNVGGWLHLEEWFFSSWHHDRVDQDDYIPQGVVFPPHFPNGFDQEWYSEGDLVDKLVTAFGEEVAIDAILAHRAEYITDDDLEMMRTVAGLSSVRLPLGWWAFTSESEGITRPDGRPSIVTDPVYSDRKFVAVTHEYLTSVLEMFARHGLTVLLDIHAAPGGSSDGSYNGVFPHDPVFFLQDSLKEQGLDIVRNLCSFFNKLPSHLQQTVSGVTLLNEPAHLLGTQSASMKAWLGSAIEEYRNSVVQPAEAGGYSFPKLYVQLIHTSIAWWDMVPYMVEHFSEDELAEWAVLDLHNYIAWGATVCMDTGQTGCLESCLNWDGLAASITLGMSSWADIVQDPRVPLKSCSEFSLATYYHSLNACRGADVLQLMLNSQIEGFESQGFLDAYFWTWRVPYGGSHEAAWSLKNFLSGSH